MIIPVQTPVNLKRLGRGTFRLSEFALRLKVTRKCDQARRGERVRVSEQSAADLKSPCERTARPAQACPCSGRWFRDCKA